MNNHCLVRDIASEVVLGVLEGGGGSGNWGHKGRSGRLGGSSSGGGKKSVLTGGALRKKYRAFSALAMADMLIRHQYKKKEAMPYLKIFYPGHKAKFYRKAIQRASLGV